MDPGAASWVQRVTAAANATGDPTIAHTTMAEAAQRVRTVAAGGAPHNWGIEPNPPSLMRHVRNRALLAASSAGGRMHAHAMGGAGPQWGGRPAPHAAMRFPGASGVVSLVPGAPAVPMHPSLAGASSASSASIGVAGLQGPAAATAAAPGRTVKRARGAAETAEGGHEPNGDSTAASGRQALGLASTTGSGRAIRSKSALKDRAARFGLPVPDPVARPAKRSAMAASPKGDTAGDDDDDQDAPRSRKGRRKARAAKARAAAQAHGAWEDSSALLRAASGKAALVSKAASLDAPALRGTSTELTRQYLRLTADPDPSQVRPPKILPAALAAICRAWREGSATYVWVCDRLKAVRQDIVVQRLVSPLAVRAYEAHARIAAEVGDAGEFNQCQTQLIGLHASPLLAAQGEWFAQSRAEFIAYRLIYYCRSAEDADAEALIGELSDSDMAEPCIAHALRVRRAVAMGDWAGFLGPLAEAAPNRSIDLMRMVAHRMRVAGLASLCQALRPRIPLSRAASLLGFGPAWAPVARGSGLIEAELEAGNFVGCKEPDATVAGAAHGSLPPLAVRAFRRIAEHCGAVLVHCDTAVPAARLDGDEAVADEWEQATGSSARDFSGDLALEIDCKSSAIDSAAKPLESLQANRVF